MESDIPQQAIQQSGIPKIDSKQMAIRYGEIGVLAYTIRQIFEKYNLDKKVSDKIIEFIFKDVPEHLVVERKFAEAGDYKGCFFAPHPYKTEAVICSDNVVSLNSQTFALSKLFAHKQKFSKAYSVAYDPQGMKIATCTDKNIYIYDLLLKKISLLQEAPDSYSCMTQLIFNHDGTKLIIFRQDPGLHQIVDLVTKKVSTKRLMGHYGMHEIIRHPDGKTFASINSKAIALWSLENEKINYLKGLEPDMWYSCLAFNFDGTQLAAGRHDGNVNIWDLENGICRLVKYYSKPPATRNFFVESHEGPRKLALAYGQDNKLFSLSDEVLGDQKSSRIDKLDVKTGKITSIARKPGRVWGSAFSSDGSKLAQIVKDEQGDVYFRYTYLLPKKCYSIEELAVMQHLYNQQLIAQDQAIKTSH